MDQQPPPLMPPYLDAFSGSIPLVLPPVTPATAPTKPVPAKPATPVAPAPVERPSTVDVWGTRFALLEMQQTIELSDQIIQRRVPEFMITANLNYLMLTEQFPELRRVNDAAVAILSDGFPIVRRSRFTRTPLPERVAGADMIVELAQLAADKGYRIFFLGAAPGVARAAADKLVERFPELRIAGCYSPPFRQLSDAEHEQMLTDIQAAGTDILLVAFGQPKGERWIYDNLRKLNVPLSIQLGASFDFLAGTSSRAPRVWRKIGCEWLYRACSDPWRLIPRYTANLAYLCRSIWNDLVAQRRTTTHSTRSSS